MGSFGLVCLKWTMPIHVLWRKRSVQFWKIDNTYSRAFEVYRIVFGSLFQTPERNPGSIVTYWIMTFTVQEKSQLLSEYPQLWSIVLTQRWARLILRKMTPHHSNYIRWDWSFSETGKIGHRGGNGRLRTSEDSIKQVKELLQNDFSLSTCAALRRLQLPSTTLHWILHMCRFFFSYKLQNLQSLNEGDKQI